MNKIDIKKYDMEKIFHDVQDLCVRRETEIINSLMTTRSQVVVGSSDFFNVDDRIDHHRIDLARYLSSSSLKELHLTPEGALEVLVTDAKLTNASKNLSQNNDSIRNGINQNLKNHPIDIREETLKKYEIQPKKENKVNEMNGYDLDKIFQDVQLLLKLEEIEKNISLAGEIDRLKNLELENLKDILVCVKYEQDSLLTQKKKLIRDDKSLLMDGSYLTKEESIKADFHGFKKWRLLRLNRKEYNDIKSRLEYLDKRITVLETRIKIKSRNVEDKIKVSGLSERLKSSIAKLDKIRSAESLDDLNMTLDSALKLLESYALKVPEDELPQSQSNARAKLLEGYKIKLLEQQNVVQPTKKLSTFINPLVPKENEIKNNPEAGQNI